MFFSCIVKFSPCIININCELFEFEIIFGFQNADNKISVIAGQRTRL